MTSALGDWETTLHLWCLWHVLKNVVKNCSSSFPDKEERENMLRLVKNAAYAATPEAFASHTAGLKRAVDGKACEDYVWNLIENKTKWAFSCRPTVLTLGMVATQRTEGMFAVAKRSGIHKKLSLCALWDYLRQVHQMMAIEHGRVANPAVGAELPFQTKHLQEFLDPIRKELGRVGASQYCQLEVKDEVGGSQSYDVDVICAGTTDDDGRPVSLAPGVLSEKLESVEFDLNLFEEAPYGIDLEDDCKHGPEAESTADNSIWARTSLKALVDLLGEVPIHLAAAVRYKLTDSRPGHVVVFGPDGFHMCSCLKLLRHGLICRHYFAVLVRFFGGKTYRGTKLNHKFIGNCVHSRWRQTTGGKDEPWSVSRVLSEAGHGDGWDGCDTGEDENFWGPTFDEDTGDGVHPSERAAKAAEERSAGDERRVFATLMARSKDNVTEMLRTVSHAKALQIQADLDKWMKFQLAEATGETKRMNPAQVKPKGRPKNSKSKPEGKTQKGEEDNGPPKQTGNTNPVGNPEGRRDNSRRTKRQRDSVGSGSGGKTKKVPKQGTP